MTAQSWSRLVRFVPVSSTAPTSAYPAAEDPEPADWAYGEPVNTELDVGAALAKGEDVEVELLEGHVPWAELKRTGKKVKVGRLLSPLTREMAGMIRCVGLNYKDHAEELKMPYPKVPPVFSKPPFALSHPNSTIPVPAPCQGEQLDWECELAVVLKKECRNISEEEAMESILGYTVGNDLTARDRQWENGRGAQWTYGKGFDHFCPLGPVLVSPSVIRDPHQLDVAAFVNGEQMQGSNTRQMIFSIGRIISFLSQGTTLPAGTVIITGTPPGVGDGRTPKVWLKDGDEVRCTIGGGIGSLCNKMRYE